MPCPKGEKPWGGGESIVIRQSNRSPALTPQASCNYPARHAAAEQSRWTRDQLLIVLNHYHKLRKLGLREETIGYGPTKEKWQAWNRE